MGRKHLLTGLAAGALALGSLLLMGCDACNDSACPAGEGFGTAVSKAKESAGSFFKSAKDGYQRRERSR